MERNVIFKCPRTGMNVQHWIPGTASDAADTHVPVRCPACASLHFVGVASGKTLSEGIGRPRAITHQPVSATGSIHRVLDPVSSAGPRPDRIFQLDPQGISDPAAIDDIVLGGAGGSLVGGEEDGELCNLVRHEPAL
ncbi:hypothetical protein ABIA45_003374 [Bradyrhizobium sp. USDA 336]